MLSQISRKFFKLEETNRQPEKVKSLLRCAAWNVCSLNNKLPEIMEHILDRNSDIVFLTETWLQSDNNAITAKVKTYGYKLVHNRRKDRAKEGGGGVGVLVKNSVSAKQLPVKHYSSFEHTVVKIQLINKKSLFVITVYRLQEVAFSTFFDEYTELLNLYVVSNEHFVIAGDINIHMETEEASAKRMQELLDLYDLKQHVDEPTHIKGHTLDVVITPNKDTFLADLHVTEIDLSHHFLIDFNVAVMTDSVKEKHTISYRSKNVNMIEFSKDVNGRLNSLPPTLDLTVKMNNYNNALVEVVNKHAPVVTKTINVVPNAPWFDKEYANLRKLRRKAEKKFRRSGLDTDKKVYLALRKEAINTSFDKKKKLVTKKLEQGSSKTLYAVVNELIDNKKEVVLPKSDSDVDLANQFQVFFKEKIEKIRASFTPTSKSVVQKEVNPDLQKLAKFAPTNADEIRNIVKSFRIKCSPEDPIPADLLSSDIDTFVPFWVEIVNLSLETGSMEGLKNALVIPLIKELTALTDTNNFKNYRPVSNLLFISKIIERVVDIRLREHMVKNRLQTDKNYGYEKNHSTELLLLKVVNDLYESFDKNTPSVLVLLDLSAAFDTVDQNKLLDILENEIGVVGVALEWFKSFLKGRTQKVKIGDCYSESMELLFGVAQGSVLGPILFKIYIRSLYKHIKATKFNVEGFADDHQLIKQFLIAFQSKALGANIVDCLKHVGEWMNEYFLKLNESKTKILVMAPPSVQLEIVIRGIFIGKECIRFVDSAKNLGVILDSVLSFENQINKVVKACFATIKKLSQVKGFLSTEHLQQLVSSLIFSLLDYCNSLYYGVNSTLMQKLQHVQNCAARLVMKRRIPVGGMDEVLMDLHWLKVKFRCIYKILLIVHNCLHGNAPNEIMSLLQYADSSRTMNLRETKTTNKYGDKSFSHVGGKLWNLLPRKIREVHNTLDFKKAVKTFLMSKGEEYCAWISRK